MENTIRNVRLRALIGVLAVAFVATAIWAAAGLAAGGSSGSGSSETSDSPAAFVQDDGNAPAQEDCPEREDEGESDATDASANL